MKLNQIFFVLEMCCTKTSVFFIMLEIPVKQRRFKWTRRETMWILTLVWPSNWRWERSSVSRPLKNFFISAVFFSTSRSLMLCCFLWSLSTTGWKVRSADVCAGVPGLSEERRIHLQHTHQQEGQSTEARASPRRPDGGENKQPDVSGHSFPSVVF